MLSNINKGWSNRNYIQPQENEKGQREKKEWIEFREAGKKKKSAFFFLRTLCQTLSQAASVQMLQYTKGPSRQ